MENYIIYKTENIENGLVYIGATSRCLSERRKDHLQKAKKGTGHKFQEAIATYGVDAFNWVQIDTAECGSELASKEKRYILEYNSLNEGYNLDCGGGITKIIYQYNLQGELINTYDDLNSAALSINVPAKKISKTCLSVNPYLDDYYWSYELVDEFTPKKDKRRKEVLQLDLEGNIVAQFKSVAEASRQTGFSKSPIAKTCRGERKSAGGFLWRYDN